MFVSQHPAVSLFFPDGPKLICCGQIVCKDKMRAVCLDAVVPHMNHHYLSQQHQTAAALTAGRERLLAGNFTPPLPYASLRQLPSCFPDGLGLFLFILLNPGLAYQHMETHMCTPRYAELSAVCLSGHVVKEQKIPGD